MKMFQLFEIKPFVDKYIVNLLKVVHCDDPVDRLNYFITPTLIVFFAGILSTKLYAGDPISCNVTPGSTTTLTEAKQYCFIRNTYYVDPREQIPEDLSERERRQGDFKYYQWIPWMLILQAIMFYLPSWIWKTAYKRSDIDMARVVTKARDLKKKEGVALSRGIEELVPYITDSLKIDPNQLFDRTWGACLSIIYLCTKFLYLLNCIAQFYILDAFIGRGYNNWCWSVVKSLWTKEARRQNTPPVFPLYTFCDFDIRQMGNVHRHTVQCELYINTFNEKIYLIFWVWLAVLTICTGLDFIWWFVTLSVPWARKYTIRSLINQSQLRDLLDGSELQGLTRAEAKRALKVFTYRALRTDGVLLWRFIKGNVGSIVATRACTDLMANYLKGEQGVVVVGAESPPGFNGVFVTPIKTDDIGFKHFGNKKRKPSIGSSISSVKSYNDKDSSESEPLGNTTFGNNSFGNGNGFGNGGNSFGNGGW